MSKSMISQKDDLTRSCLEGKVAPEVLCAPKTGGDPRYNSSQWPDIHGRSIGYLDRNVVDKPWADHLTLAAAVLSAHRYDVSTVRHTLNSINVRLTQLFQALQIQSLEEWDAEPCIIAYLKGELLPGDPNPTRSMFCSYYLTCVKQVGSWLNTLSLTEKATYKRFLLPPIHPIAVSGLNKKRQVNLQAQQKRKEETDAVVVQFSDLRAEAHYRYNRIVRLRQAYLDAINAIRTSNHQEEREIFPFAFSYDEGADPERGIPALERLHFRIWNRRSFVLAHRESYAPSTYYSYKNK